MTKHLFIKKTNSLIKVCDSIMNIGIEDTILFRNMVFNITDEIIFSINDIEVNLSKRSLILKDLFSLDLNDKKMIGALHKYLIRSMDEELIQLKNELEYKYIQAIQDLALKIDFDICFNDEIDFIKLLPLFQVEFKNLDISKYLESLIYYIKIYNYFNNIDLIITYGLIDVLTKEEVQILSNELDLLQINLINISFNNSAKGFVQLTIDNDYCII